MADPKIVRRAWEVLQRSNRKPPDELADVREKIKALKEREEVLRTELITGKASWMGDDFRVVVAKKTIERIDNPKIRKELGLAFLRPFMMTVETTFVNVYPKKDPSNGET